MTTGPDFEILVESHSDELYAYLWRLLRDPADAEDCLQDTFLRAYRAYPDLVTRPAAPPETNYRAWLYKIATNVARTSLKRRTRTASRTTDLDTRTQGSTIPVPDQVAIKLELADLIQAIEALPEKQRTTLILRKYQEMPYDMISSILEISESAARANVYQALKKLRARFDPGNDRR